MAKHWGSDPRGRYEGSRRHGAHWPSDGHERWTPEVPRKTSVLPILLGAALAAPILILAFALFA